MDKLLKKLSDLREQALLDRDYRSWSDAVFWLKWARKQIALYNDDALDQSFGILATYREEHLTHFTQPELDALYNTGKPYHLSDVLIRLIEPDVRRKEEAGVELGRKLTAEERQRLGVHLSENAKLLGLSY